MLARKISRAKWDPKDNLGPDEIGADVNTGCLRTANNSLSFWRCTGDRPDVAEIALAIACTMAKFEKIHVVTLAESIFEPLGLRVRATAGETPVGELRSRHVDVQGLDVVRLTNLAQALAPVIRDDKTVTLFTKSDLVELVRRAVHQKRVHVSDLNQNLLKELS